MCSSCALHLWPRHQPDPTCGAFAILRTSVPSVVLSSVPNIRDISVIRGSPLPKLAVGRGVLAQTPYNIRLIRAIRGYGRHGTKSLTYTKVYSK